MIGDLANHLWQSTLFVGLIALLGLVMRRNRAEIRYWLWLSASLKFLVPLALLINAGRQLEAVPAAQELAAQIPTPAADYTVQITQPFSIEGTTWSTPQAKPAQTGSWIPVLLFVTWLSGVTGILFMRLRAWFRVRAVVRDSVPLNLPGGLDVRSSPHVLEPGVIGVLRPILLLPGGIESRLTPSQMRAVLAHEYTHVLRRDNLTSMFHMVVECLFWFHPLVWWIGARLVAERERACDEEVLRQGNEPVIYAEGILNVCKFYRESPLICVSGVSGSDIKTRIENIMKNRTALGLSFGKALLLGLVTLIVVAGPVSIGAVLATASRAMVIPTVAPPAVPALAVPEPASAPVTPVAMPAPPSSAPIQGAGQDRFEVVSIRPADMTPVPGGRGGAGPGVPGGAACAGNIQIDPGRINIMRVTVYRLIVLAHGKHCRASTDMDLVANAPEWTKSVMFDIQATLPAGTPLYTVNQLNMGEAPRLQTMLVHLLEDRFQLTLHRTSKEVPLYNLLLVREGRIKLSEDQSTPPPLPPPTGQFVRQDPALPPPAPPRGAYSLGVSPPEGIVRIAATAVPMATIINIFQGQEGRFVIDKTGFKGLIDIVPAALDVGPYDITPNAVSVWPEIMQGLGLKLEPARGPVEVLVIDRLQRPTEN